MKKQTILDLIAARDARGDRACTAAREWLAAQPDDCDIRAACHVTSWCTWVVEWLTDQAALAAVARADENWHVRLAAVAMLSDQAVLAAVSRATRGCYTGGYRLYIRSAGRAGRQKKIYLLWHGGSGGGVHGELGTQQWDHRYLWRSHARIFRRLSTVTAHPTSAQ